MIKEINKEEFEVKNAVIQLKYNKKSYKKNYTLRARIGMRIA